MSNELITAAAAVQARSGFLTRFDTEAKAEYPQLDPMVSTLLLDFLMGLVAGCGEQPTPEEAVAKVKELDVFQQSFLRARFARNVRAARIKNPERNAAAAVSAVMRVAQTATPQEQIEFAASLIPFQDEDAFNIF